MAQPETGGVRKTEGEDNADIWNVNIRDEQSDESRSQSRYFAKMLDSDTDTDTDSK